MNKKEFIKKWGVVKPEQLNPKVEEDTELNRILREMVAELSSDLDSVIQSEIERRLPTREEMITEGKERFPISKPRNYLVEGQRLGWDKAYSVIRKKLLNNKL